MNTRILTVSHSPHIHTDTTVSKTMYGVILAMAPALLVSVYTFGLGALRVSLLAVISCFAFEYLISRYLLKRLPSVLDGSAILTGLLLAFNLPSNIPWFMIVIGSLVAVGVGKMAFGGLGNNPFNPALVGRVFLLISFPAAMTSWPLPMANQWSFSDAVTGATPLGMMKESLQNGESMTAVMSEMPSYLSMLIGTQAGSLGEISALAMIIGLLFMLYKKIISWHIPISIFGTIFIIAGILWLISPGQFANPIFHLLTGGVMLGAVFMATDYVTSPMTKTGMLIFGIGIGLITIVIRTWGAYPEGISFAILIMNAFVPVINKYVKPKRFGIKRNK